MSKINIQGIVSNIKSKANVYTPIIEAIVNSIEAIEELNQVHGKIYVIIKREEILDIDSILPNVIGFEIQDNGIGFNQKHRDSFDTLYGTLKENIGGKGFGRFMFLKYFKEVKIESIYKEGEDFFQRKFHFGKQYDIIKNETNEKIKSNELKTKVIFNFLKEGKHYEKEIETMVRKLLEKLLIFFINENFSCPDIIIKEDDGSKEINLNDYLSKGKEIEKTHSYTMNLQSKISDKTEKFDLKIFKIYYAGHQKSKISLTAHNREVIETPLYNYIPEFYDDFYDEIERKSKEYVKKNYIIKTYVLSEYLDNNVSLERETFNFDKEKSDEMYEFSQFDIEKKVAEITRDYFANDVKLRLEKKTKKIKDYIKNDAPWHKSYFDDLDLSNLQYNLSNEDIELEFQKIKFKKETETRNDIKSILEGDNKEFDEKYNEIISKLTNIGKNDLAHYVCNRKVVLQVFQEMLKRREDGSAQLEKGIHNIIFPMGRDSTEVSYENHNLWILDERLVFSEYIASDKKISKGRTSKEPDLIIFDKKTSFRSGDNEFSNPLTIFEFKRPKRKNYNDKEDPINQIGNYLEEIKAGKYETPYGIEKLIVNDNTPVYGYIICDIEKKIQEFAKRGQLTISPDNEGYFGYHTGYKMYIEIITYKKLLKDAEIRNRIFFNKLKIE